MTASPARQASTADDLPAPEELERSVEHALAIATDAGASGADASAGTSTGLSAGVRLGEVETLEHHRQRDLSVTVYFGQRTGSASTTDFREQAVRDAVEAACRIARFTAEDPYAGLPDPAALARETRDLDLHHPWSLTAEQAVDLALECENAARAEAGVTNSEGASVDTFAGVMALGNTHGFLASERGSRHAIGCAVIGGEGDSMQRDYWHSAARAAADLEPAADIGRRAAARTLARLGATQIPTTSCPVLFTPEMSRSLVGHLVGAVRGSALYREASFLRGRLGEQLFPEFVRIHEQPHLPRALGSCNFDREGVATAPRDLVSDGVLRGYVLDSYAGRRLGMASTGNAGGVHNLTLDPGTESFDELVRQMDRGLIVSEMMGMGVNTVTGDYSRGAAGFWVENGRISHPVQEITVAGTLQEMFSGIVALGNDLDTRGSLRTPSVLIDRMTVAGS